MIAGGWLRWLPLQSIKFDAQQPFNPVITREFKHASATPSAKTTNNIGEVKAKAYNIDNSIIDEFTGQARSDRRSFSRRDSSRTRRGRRREMRECGASERIVRATTPLVFGN